MHVHVFSGAGEAKFWLEPAIELAENRGIPARELKTIAAIVEERTNEIATAWRKHFGR